MRSGQFEDVASLSDLLYRVGASHNVGLNYGNIRDTRRTIEYRYFDSSLDPVDTCMLFSPSTSTATTSIAHTGASVFRARLPRSPTRDGTVVRGPVIRRSPPRLRDGSLRCGWLIASRGRHYSLATGSTGCALMATVTHAKRLELKFERDRSARLLACHALAGD